MADEQTTTNDNPVENTILGSGSDNQGDWRSSLPDELKNDATLQNFKDVESLAKTVVHRLFQNGRANASRSIGSWFES